MSLNFPTNAANGTIYTLDNRSWQWNGTAWKLLATSSINNTPIGNAIANTGAFTTLSASGNITGSYFIGNGSQLSGISVDSAAISNGTSNVRVVSSGGNIAVSIAGNANVVVITSGQVNVKGNLVPDASNIYSLGTSTNRWSNLWVSGNTITLGNIVLKDGNASNFSVFTSDGITPANLQGQMINTTGVGYNAANLTASGNISNAYNAQSAGPLTINSGVTITVNTGATWTIV
jgi:hypothetical protein